MLPKRTVRAVTVLSLLAVLLAACGGIESDEAGDDGGTVEPSDDGDSAADDSDSSADAPAEPIKIGVPVPETGTFAPAAPYMVEGIELYLEQNDNTIGGRDVELVFVDTQGDPDLALDRTRRLVDLEEVDVIIGYLTAREGYSVADLVNTSEVPTIMPIVASDDLTQRSRDEFVVRAAGNSSSQWTHPLGEYAYQEMDARNAVTFGMDYAFGWESAGGFSRTFIENGGEVLDTVWTPIGTSDFSPFLSQLQEQDPDIVYALYAGGDAINFLQAWDDFGLRGEIPLVGSSTLTDEDLLLEESGEGYLTSSHYVSLHESEANQNFADAYFERTGNPPSYIAEAMYSAALWVDQAVASLDGDISDSQEFLEAIRSVQVDNAPRGPMELDEYGNPIQNVYIRRSVLGEGGVIWNETVKEYEGVSQFWNYSPEEYLEQPLYTRESVEDMVEDPEGSPYFP